MSAVLARRGVANSAASRRVLRVIVGVVTTLAAVSVAGCARKSVDENPTPLTQRYTVPLTVENRYRADLTLYVVHDGLASRLTVINSASTTKATIPAHMIGTLSEVTLVVEALGVRSGFAPRYTSPRIRVLRGQGILWTLETTLERSFAQIVPGEVVPGDSVRK